MGEPAPFSVPNTQTPPDRITAVRAHAWVGLVASGLWAAFAVRVFFIMFAPTHSFATAFDLWRHDKGVRIAIPALLIITLGSLLTFNRLRRAESWAQLKRTDRALSIVGIIPSALLYYPIVAGAMLIAWMLYFCMVKYANLVARIDRHMPWSSQKTAKKPQNEGS